jgi:hypothetical protein
MDNESFHIMKIDIVYPISVCIMEQLYILKQIIINTENSIKLMKIDEFNRVWLQDIAYYNIFMSQLVCSSVKYITSRDNYVCQVKFNYAVNDTVLVEINSVGQDSQSINVYMNGILEYEQDKRMTSLGIYEVNRCFNNHGKWDVTLHQVNEMVIKVLHIVNNNKLIKG